MGRKRAGRDLDFGKSVQCEVVEAVPEIVCQDQRLKGHVEQPWFRAYVAQRIGESLQRSGKWKSRDVEISDEAQARHTLLCGSTGSGKSRAMKHFFMSAVDAGCSGVLLDPKGELADLILAEVAARRIDARSVRILDPRHPEAGVPGWNPLDSNVPLIQAVSDWVGQLQHSSTSWGPRLGDMLTNGLLVVGEHRLSLFELGRFLVREEYRSALLARPIQPRHPLAYAEAVTYFQHEFGAWSRSERGAAVSPVLNKIRELLRSEFLFPLLCSRRNTLDLAALWQRPGLVIVRLDRPALGEEGTRLLAGLLTQLLFRTALRASGPVPVVLAIDELPVLERFVGAALTEIVTVARSQGLRLLVACQHLAQLSAELREALLANAGVQAFFKLGYQDARVVAASLAAGADSRLTRVVASLEQQDRQTRLPVRAEWRHPICDPHGRALRLNGNAWAWFARERHFRSDLAKCLQTLAQSIGISRLYVCAADTGDPVELAAYVAKLSPGEYRIDGPTLELVVSFPRPRLTGVEWTNEAELTRRWIRVIQELPVQHAVVRAGKGGPDVVRVQDVTNAQVGLGTVEAFTAASHRANCQSPREVAEMIRLRREAVDAVSLPTRGNSIQEAEDGSLT